MENSFTDDVHLPLLNNSESANLNEILQIIGAPVLWVSGAVLTIGYASESLRGKLLSAWLGSQKLSAGIPEATMATISGQQSEKWLCILQALGAACSLFLPLNGAREQRAAQSVFVSAMSKKSIFKPTLLLIPLAVFVQCSAMYHSSYLATRFPTSAQKSAMQHSNVVGLIANVMFGAVLDYKHFGSLVQRTRRVWVAVSFFATLLWACAVVSQARFSKWPLVQEWQTEHMDLALVHVTFLRYVNPMRV